MEKRMQKQRRNFDKGLTYRCEESACNTDRMHSMQNACTRT